MEEKWEIQSERIPVQINDISSREIIVKPDPDSEIGGMVHSKWSRIKFSFRNISEEITFDAIRLAGVTSCWTRCEPISSSATGPGVRDGGRLIVPRCFPELPTGFLFHHSGYNPFQMLPFFVKYRQLSVFVLNHLCGYRWPIIRIIFRTIGQRGFS